MMQENPYSGILNLMKHKAAGQIPAAYFFGQVKNTGPLAVTVSGLEQSGSSLVKNADIGELHAGDTVFLVPLESSQKFLVLCRVVGI